jgi:hypothetical protein
LWMNVLSFSSCYSFGTGEPLCLHFCRKSKVILCYVLSTKFIIFLSETE